MNTVYEREGRVIRNIETKTSQIFKSISLAKKESRKLQQENGGLGKGFLRVKIRRNGKK